MKIRQPSAARPCFKLFATMASVGIVSLHTASAASLIVAENFGGTGDTLNDTTADTFDGAITTAGGSSTWVSPTSYLDDGTIAGTNTTGYLNLGSYINDSKGTATGLFTLSATLNETSGSRWVGFGFFESNTPGTGNNFTATGSEGMGVIIYRSGDELDGFPGPGSDNGSAITTGTGSGAELLTLVLDLTPGGGYDAGNLNFGKITFYQGDTSGTNLGSYTYTTNESFGSIGLTASSSTGTISDLKLTQVPEPTAALLGSLGAFLLLRRRR